MAYVIAAVCVLLTIAGLIWYVSLTRKGEDPSDNATEEGGKQ